MKTRHLRTLADLSVGDIQALFRDTAAMKRQPSRHRAALAGQTVALVFQKPSMRTRVAFEVAVWQLGGQVTYLDQANIHLGQREPAKDAARVLSRYVDAIVLRTFAHSTVEEFATYSSVPVINGLSDVAHPCQALADLYTIQERVGALRSVRLAYVGDGNNVLNSLIQGCGMLGVPLAVATPNGYKPDAGIWSAAVRRAKAAKVPLPWTQDPRAAVRGARVVYTDVWTSMGQEAEQIMRRKTFPAYQVNDRLLFAAAKGGRVMHCLPAHRGEEITDQVMESDRSLVWEQAENRLHVQKALLVHLMKGSRR